MKKMATESPLVTAVVACGECDNAIRQPIDCQTLFGSIFESNTMAIMITDRDTRIIAVNRTFVRLTGYSEEEAVGRTPQFLKSGRHDATFYQAMWSDLREQGEWTGEVWDKRKNGSFYPNWMHIKAVHGLGRDEGGEPVYYVASFMDISLHKEAEERIRELAYHDVLTGLPNRLLLQDRLNHALASAQRRRHHLAVLFIDLDSFKNVNDSLGHVVGDQLLTEVASRLLGSVRDVDTVARLGGDEFVVVLENLNEKSDAVSVAAKIHTAFDRPITVGALTLHSTASIGIAIYPEDGDSVENLIQNADTAMYQAKALGRGNYQFFATFMNERAREKLALENTLKDALGRDEFQLYYQPIIDIETGTMTCAEALIRWDAPGQGLIPPDKFIPIAEETGAIVAIGDWVIRKVCRDLATWRGQGFTPPRVSLNISPRQFRQPDLAAHILAILQEAQVSAGQLELEVTESALMEHPDMAASILYELKGVGLGIVIDDFGTGYSSLAYLKKFPIDKLKIDRSFVRDLLSDNSDREITLAVIALSHNLGLQVTAEGVEEQAQLDFLRRHGCDFVQGYLFSRPLPSLAFLSFLESGGLPIH